MIEKNMLRACIRGDLKWVSREELEQYVSNLYEIQKSEDQQDDDDRFLRVEDGVKAVVAAGCNRRRLGELVKKGALYIPPSNINPEQHVKLISGARRECLDFINTFPMMHSMIIPLSVTQQWWMRKHAPDITEILLEYGAAMSFEPHQVKVCAGSPQLLDQCIHRLLQLLVAFVDVKIKVSIKDMETVEKILKTCHQRDCFGVWHDGVLEVQGGRDSVQAVIHSSLVSQKTVNMSILSKDCKLISVHPHADKSFICGKKDGKLTRIIREQSVSIELRDSGTMLNPDTGETRDALLQVTTTGPAFDKVYKASLQVDDELPTVKIAHIPSHQHRRLIGQAGKNIQRIMKRHAVYVKFYNAAESREEFGGALEWHLPPHLFICKNVVIKTPSKNGAACEASYQDILEECGLVEAPVKSVESVVEVEQVLQVRLGEQQVIGYSTGQWKVFTFGLGARRPDSVSLDLRPRAETILISSDSCDDSDNQSYDNTLAKSEADIFTLFPSAFHLGPVGSELITTRSNLKDTHKEDDSSKDTVDEVDEFAEIERLMRAFETSVVNRKASVGIFEL
jgi:hypothetical protein